MTTATLSPTASNASASRGGASFLSIFASEWSKLAALRSTHVTLAIGFALSIATSALVSVAIGSTRDSWNPNFNPITVSMVGTIFALIVYSVFAVLVGSREYSSGLIRLTLSATPRRGRVLAAKFALVVLITLVLGELTTVSMFFAGQAILGAYGMPTASLADPDAFRMVVGLGATMIFFPTVGLALGVILRSTAGGITAVLGLLWLPQIFGEFVPMWWRENILSLLPSNGLDSMTVSHIEPSPAFSDPAVGAVIAATWLAVAVSAAFFAFTRRDA